MPAAPILHVGYPKTAATWFQQHFYPALASHVLVPQHRSLEALSQAHFLGGDDAGDGTAALRDCLSGKRGLPAILCDETLIGGPRHVGLGGGHAGSVAALLHRLRPDAHVVIFVRAQPAMIAANYGEYLRGGGKGSIAAYLFPDRHGPALGLHRLSRPRVRLEHFEYDRIVACYDRLFGPAQVHVHAYEALASDPQGVIAALARDLGLTLAAPPPLAIRPNRSYGRRLLPAVRLANRFCLGRIVDEAPLLNLPGWYRLSRAILARLNRPAIAGAPPTANDLL
ncbi:MAG: hypothetical protein RIQ46_545, partial [Pseudomonadota bacterium]